LPTVLRVEGFRFFFYSNERQEPPHIHVEKAENVAKYWLNPIALADAVGFSSKELYRIAEIVKANQSLFLEAWYAHFSK
jgi:hypothetical protein